MRRNLVQLLALGLMLLTLNSGAQTFTILHTFTNTPDGAMPRGGLILSSNTFYGTTANGGSFSNGAVFTINTDGTGFTNIYSFSPGSGSFSNLTNSDGASPQGELILGGNTLYGTASQGGSSGAGTVFALKTDGTCFTNLYAFTAASYSSGYTNSDGAFPLGSLILSGNTLYGTTARGGIGGFGTVFALNTDGSGFTNLHCFTKAYASSYYTNGDGAQPNPKLILSGNTLYGTTAFGGPGGDGTLFSINTDGTDFTNFYNFTPYINPPDNANGDGAFPNYGLVLSGNTLYGTAGYGGSFGYGTLFSINIDGSDFKNLHSFLYSDGALPAGGLILAGNVLFGTTVNGGYITSGGTVFSMNTEGINYTNLHIFTVNSSDPSNSDIYINSDGAYPIGTLFFFGNTLFGTASSGGLTGAGTMFSISLPATNCTIAVRASPDAGGTVSSDGIFLSGSSNTVTATANSSYTFTNWTESGVVVSSSPSYTFTLNGDRALVANFTQHYTIAASASPDAGGTVSGDGIFLSGSSNTVTATANNGYTFTNWTENGVAVSSSPGYTFMLNADRSLVANFIQNSIINPDLKKPTVNITSLKRKWQLFNPNFMVTGTARDNVAVANVYYALNDSGWVPASTANNWTNWTANIVPRVGINTIQAKAVDTSGNIGYSKRIKLRSAVP